MQLEEVLYSSRRYQMTVARQSQQSNEKFFTDTGGSIQQKEAIDIGK